MVGNRRVRPRARLRWPRAWWAPLRPSRGAAAGRSVHLHALSASNINYFNVTGLYAQDLLDFGHGIKALVGVRHDRFSQRTVQRIAGLPNLARVDNTWSPRGSGPPARHEAVYYASWSRSYQPSGETFALAASNADLAPEKTENKEIGAKYNPRTACRSMSRVSSCAAPTSRVPIR
jgi:outer membrane receptor protein involved in Fe transport